MKFTTLISVALLPIVSMAASEFHFTNSSSTNLISANPNSLTESVCESCTTDLTVTETSASTITALSSSGSSSSGTGGIAPVVTEHPDTAFTTSTYLTTSCNLAGCSTLTTEIVGELYTTTVDGKEVTLTRYRPKQTSTAAPHATTVPVTEQSTVTLTTTSCKEDKCSVVTGEFISTEVVSTVSGNLVTLTSFIPCETTTESKAAPSTVTLTTTTCESDKCKPVTSKYIASKIVRTVHSKLVTLTSFIPCETETTTTKTPETSKVSKTTYTTKIHGVETVVTTICPETETTKTPELLKTKTTETTKPVVPETTIDVVPSSKTIEYIETPKVSTVVYVSSVSDVPVTFTTHRSFTTPGIVVVSTETPAASTTPQISVHTVNAARGNLVPLGSGFVAGVLGAFIMI
ncbi:BA75_02899T0 [Komagataella pastoris]|uniref:BA75_02899T0 n=1 Tax=Komagataella pastoris TaxID=4922 RepID=A0A1B2JAF1_PICPA|nr:BA75_02899T0 [Komagataella pastoris]